MRKCAIIAHRGASNQGYQENTIAAFENALTLGVDMIEFDIRITKDLKYVCFHDEAIANQKIKSLTHTELNQLFGDSVPTLKEILQLDWQKTLLDIEIKESGYEKPLLDLIQTYLEPEQFLIKSFLDITVKKISRLAPEVNSGLLLGLSKPQAAIRTRWQELFPEARLKLTQAKFVAPHYRLLHFAFVQRMHRLGYPVYVWTVNDFAAMQKYYRWGVDGLITDRPDLALKLPE